MRRSVFERVNDFVAGRGFYVVLLVCVAAIGISLYYLITGVQDSLELDEPVAGTAQVTVSPSPSPSPSSQAPQVVTPPAQQSEEPAPSSPSPSPQSSQEPQTSSQPQPPQSAPSSYTWPVEGEILRTFSVEVLAYDQTMGDWRTHSGVDIAAAVGTTVVSTAPGLVTAVDQSDLMGTTVTVDHGGGVVATYANLDPQVSVEVGQEVFEGTALGAVGTTALAESALAEHLHFSLQIDGEEVDPLEYLP